MDIEKPQKVVREIVTNVEEEEESLVEERSKLERAVMTRLASPSLQQLEAALQENRSLLQPQEPHKYKLFDVIQKIADSIDLFVVYMYHVYMYMHIYMILCMPPPTPTSPYQVQT